MLEVVGLAEFDLMFLRRFQFDKAERAETPPACVDKFVTNLVSKGYFVALIVTLLQQ